MAEDKFLDLLVKATLCEEQQEKRELFDKAWEIGLKECSGDTGENQETFSSIVVKAMLCDDEQEQEALFEKAYEIAIMENQEAGAENQEQ